ncbi:S8 family serine peptidase [Sodalis sp. RH21]|uniref:S8 family serine peptidase n=1 Tax=unclassified Sodalis (in: enterobacteria) TaxID=2636512 RepID=UPI0039B415E8
MLNSWGEQVTTLAYGDLQNWNFPNRYYTSRYGGTSSATPLVAAVLAVVQSYAKNKYQTIFNCRQMHDIMIFSGYRQAAGEGIGFRPNTVASLDRVDQLLDRWIIRPWRNNVFYPVGALVTFSGSISQCLVAHTSPSGFAIPAQIQYWRVVPPWTFPRFYAVGERVSIDGRVFQNRLAHTSSSASRPSSPATDNLWLPIPA